MQSLKPKKLTSLVDVAESVVAYLLSIGASGAFGYLKYRLTLRSVLKRNRIGS
jgi:hypothetical protein